MHNEVKPHSILGVNVVGLTSIQLYIGHFATFVLSEGSGGSLTCYGTMVIFHKRSVFTLRC